MDCLYLENGMCRAKPPSVGYYGKPDEETVKNYCQNVSQMRTCPRMITYHEYLKSFNGK